MSHASVQRLSYSRWLLSYWSVDLDIISFLSCIAVDDKEWISSNSTFQTNNYCNSVSQGQVKNGGRTYLFYLSSGACKKVIIRTLNTIAWKPLDPNSVNWDALGSLPLLLHAAEVLPLARSAKWPDSLEVAKSVAVCQDYGFEHYLSKYYADRNHTEYPSMRAVEEKKILTVLPHLSSDYLNKNCSLQLIDTILAIASELSGAASEIRAVDVYTNSDSHHVRIKYPSPESIPSTLKSIQKCIDNWRGSRLLLAIMVSISFVACHPFIDCNGRISRILFNYICGLKGDAYIPLAEINFFSRGGYEIRLRKAVMFGSWVEIVEYFSAVICLGEKNSELEQHV